jgi:hypothetical protein
MVVELSTWSGTSRVTIGAAAEVPKSNKYKNPSIEVVAKTSGRTGLKPTAVNAEIAS